MQQADTEWLKYIRLKKSQKSYVIEPGGLGRDRQKY